MLLRKELMVTIMKIKSNCETCMNYFYDDEYECYTCAMNLDEDEYRHFIQDTFSDCPYYRRGDDYTIVRKQI